MSKTVWYLFNLLTSPGVMVHELAHALFCVLARVKIYKIKLFQFKETAGYVQHEEPRKFLQGFLISIGPLLINSGLALFLFSIIQEPYYVWQNLLYIYLAVVIGLHAIPSGGDAKSLFQMANHKIWRNPFILIAYPFILLLYILFLLKKIKIHIVYVGFLFWLAKFYL